jgi:hypothetical protein
LFIPGSLLNGICSEIFDRIALRRTKWLEEFGGYQDLNFVRRKSKHVGSLL